jgi:hypothetical protein
MNTKIRSPVMGGFGTLCCETKKGAVGATTNTQEQLFS